MNRATRFFGNTVDPRITAATAIAAGLTICLAMLLTAAPAQAQEFRVNGELAGALFVDEPQSDRFGPGFYMAVRPGLALGNVFALQWSYSLLLATAGDGFEESGTAHSFTTGVRLRPFGEFGWEEDQLDGLFVDFNVGYVRTDNLDRFGFDTGIGYNFQVMPTLALGPFARYIHIIQPDHLEGVDSNDAQVLALGLSLSFGPAYQEPEVPESLECPSCPSCEPGPVCEPDDSLSASDGACRDWDGDGVCDDDDRCPTQSGPKSTQGCPSNPCTGDPLVVMVQFELDSAGMPEYRSTGEQTMDPVLEAVATAIGNDDSCDVCILGHASKEGAAEYNQELSVARATAVQQYMTARGVPKSRIPIVGMGKMCPLVPHESLVMNRRVEFHRLQEGEQCPTSCL